MSVLQETPQPARAVGVEIRGRLRDHLAAALPDAEVRNRLITTREETRRVEITTPRETGEPVPPRGGQPGAPSNSGWETEYRDEVLDDSAHCVLNPAG
jgi:hypothetical protein